MIFLSELLEAGAEKNSNLPMFGGYYFCKTCGHYNYHTAYSMKIDEITANFEVCDKCKTYNGLNEDRFHKYQNTLNIDEARGNK